MPLSVDFWEERYASQHTPWDLAKPAPPFVALIKKEHLPPGKMAVLGAGRGHDAAFFARQGYEVMGFDYATLAIQEATEVYGDLCRFVQADIFNLPTQYQYQFDYVLEHTCFCAIHPTQRQAYVKTVDFLLKPGGKLVGLFWDHDGHGGPPYSTPGEEVKRLFKTAFETYLFEKTSHSIPSRQNEEWLAIFKKPTL